MEKYRLHLEEMVYERTRELQATNLKLHAEIQEKKQAEEDLNSAYEHLKKSNIELKEFQSKLVQAGKISALGQLSSSVAYELNDPLKRLLHLLDDAKRKCDNSPEHVRIFKAILECAEQMSSALNNFTSFVGQAKEKVTKIDFNDLIESTLSFSKNQFVRNNIELNKQYAANLPKIIGYKGQLQHVVLNIFSHACAAMPKGGKFSIITDSIDDNNNVRIEFSDTGEGIEGRNLINIFDPSYNAKESQAQEGLGLFLPIAYNIIKEHNGKVFVESKPNQGTKFTILFPAVG